MSAFKGPVFDSKKMYLAASQTVLSSSPHTKKQSLSHPRQLHRAKQIALQLTLESAYSTTRRSRQVFGYEQKSTELRDKQTVINKVQNGFLRYVIANLVVLAGIFTWFYVIYFALTRRADETK